MQTHIVFARSGFGGNGRDLLIVDLKGHLWHLTRGLADDFEPDWSPDGSSVAFVHVPSGPLETATQPPQVWRIGVSAGAPTQMTHLRNGATWPSWSPDGEELVVGSSGKLYVVDAASGYAHRVRTDARYPFVASWSPDGTELVFAGGIDSDHDIYVQSLGTSSARRLSQPGSLDSEPDWSSTKELQRHRSDTQICARCRWAADS